MSIFIHFVTFNTTLVYSVVWNQLVYFKSFFMISVKESHLKGLVYFPRESDCQKSTQSIT